MKGKPRYPAIFQYTFILCIILCLSVLGGCSRSENKLQETNIPVTKTKTPKKGEVVTDSTEIIAMAGSIVEKMTLKEKIGQMFVVNLEQLDKAEGNYYEFRQFTKNMADTLEKYPVGGIILFARNIESIDQTKTLIADAQMNTKVPLFVSVDEEGGSVARIGNNSNMHTTSFPPMEEIGSMNDEDYVYNMGVTIGKEIKELGFNLDFAPVADVKTNEYNTEIGDRAFGSDAKLVSNMVRQVVNGIQDQNVSATLKHFRTW